MSDIDEMVELARTHMADGHDRLQCDVCLLALAVIAMAPVIEAARKQAEAHGAYAAAETRVAWMEQARAAYATVLAVRDLDAEARRG